MVMMSCAVPKIEKALHDLFYVVTYRVHLGVIWMSGEHVSQSCRYPEGREVTFRGQIPPETEVEFGYDLVR